MSNRPFLKKCGLLILSISFVLFVCLIGNLLFITIPPIKEVKSESLQLDAGLVAERLGRAIKIKTVSRFVPGEGSNTLQVKEVEVNLYRQLHELLENEFPLVHKHLKLHKFANNSLFYTWQGASVDAPSIMFSAHQDVVPFSFAHQSKWEYPPFAGRVADGYVWGRGALDDKSSLMAILESAEYLLKSGYQPRHTIHFAFGHDEEVGGEGAKSIAVYMEKHQIAPEMMLDEGGFVMRDVIPGVSQPVGLVGVAEKGYLSVQLSADGLPGHSSMPPQHTAVGIVAAAISRLEQAPPPARLDGATKGLFSTVTPYMDLGERFVFSNMWLFEPLVISILKQKPTTNATVSTTLATTMISGGTKDNVLPQSASAVINLRLLPGDTIEAVLAYIKQTIADDQVQVRALPNATEASSISEVNSEYFETLRGVGHQVFSSDKIIMAPYLTIAATDSRHYSGIVKSQYRFLPIMLIPDDLSRIHGPNERISVEAYLKMIQFYTSFIKEVDKI